MSTSDIAVITKEIQELKTRLVNSELRAVESDRRALDAERRVVDLERRLEAVEGREQGNSVLVTISPPAGDSGATVGKTLLAPPAEIRTRASARINKAVDGAPIPTIDELSTMAVDSDSEVATADLLQNPSASPVTSPNVSQSVPATRSPKLRGSPRKRQPIGRRGGTPLPSTRSRGPVAVSSPESNSDNRPARARTTPKRFRQIDD